jgi:hypothetical protein
MGDENTGVVSTRAHEDSQPECDLYLLFALIHSTTNAVKYGLIESYPVQATEEEEEEQEEKKDVEQDTNMQKEEEEHEWPSF